MRVSTRLAVVLSIASLGGCEPIEVEDEPRAGLLHASVAHRYVALMPAGEPCPAVDGWAQRRLFHLTQPARQAWDVWEEAGGVMPPVLERFCVYIAQGVPADPPAVPGAVRVDPDVDVVVPQSVATVEEVRAERLLAMLGATPAGSTAPAGDPYFGDPEGLPYVAIVDTADSTPPGLAAAYPSNPAAWSARHRHGLTMATLVDQTRCSHGETACLARQYRAQAFPFDAVDEPEVVPSGGQWASLGSLASALGESIAGWRARPDGGMAPLIVNMSLGWDPQHGTVDVGHAALLDANHPDPTVSATVQAVHSVMAWGACQGVLSVAASGNVRGSTCDELGPVAPASWESLPVLSAATCSAVAGALASTSGRPRLVYGAGGAAAPATPIANARVESLPPRVLFAHQGVLTSGSGHTSAWTGSSLASAALASMAASLRSYARAMDAVGTMNTIDASGRLVVVDPAWLQSWVSQARMITFEGVFVDLLGSTGPYRAQGGAGLEDAIAAEVLGQPQMFPNPAVIELEESPDGEEACGPATNSLSIPPGAAELPPAGWESDESRPQPHVPICPTCPVLNTSRGTSGATPSFSLFIAIDPAYDPQDIQQAVLSFDDPGGSGGVRVILPSSAAGTLTAVVDLATIKLPSGESVEDWIVARSAIRAGRLDFVIDQGRSAQLVSQVVDVIK